MANTLMLVLQQGILNTSSPVLKFKKRLRSR